MNTTAPEGAKPFIEMNAIIQNVSIQLDRDIFLSVWLQLDFGGCGQGFGGYVLGGTPDTLAGQHSNQKNLCGEFIVSCMRAGDVDNFKDLEGKTIRVRKTDELGSILAIGHIVRNDRWFNPSERFKEMGVAA